jgi:opacity protein-like surface antigen
VTFHRTSLLALLLAVAPVAGRAADVPLPPPPAGTSLDDGGSPGRAFKLAVLGGFLAQGEIGSPSLAVDLGMVATPPSWRRVQLEWHLPIRVARPHWEGILFDSVGDPNGTTEDTIWLGEALASARLLVPVATGFSLFAEAGVGLAFTSEEHVEDETFVGVTTDTKLVIAPSFQGSIGLTYALSERLDVVFQPVAFGRRAKADESTLSALWGLSYRL